MPRLANERVAYHNGQYLPESRVALPFRDRGFVTATGYSIRRAPSGIVCSGSMRTSSGSTAACAMSASTLG